MDQSRNDPIRIKLKIRGIVLIPAQGHDVIYGFLALLLQRYANLLCADRIDVVIEFQHVILPHRPIIKTKPLLNGPVLGVLDRTI
jgi:hypothetical protein